MKIYGLQKLTLIDYPGKVAATVFLGGCNFRCPFCHNAGLVTGLDGSASTDSREILDLLRRRAGLLDGICISGGEPLLQNDAVDFIRALKEMGYAVKLDTNGSFPDKLQYLVSNKLIDYVAMDIKNALPAYGKTVGLADFDTTAVEASADFLMDGDFPYEFRTTVVRGLHCKLDFEQIGARFHQARQYYLQTFIDSGDVIEPGLSGFTKPEMEGFRKILLRYMPQVELREI